MSQPDLAQDSTAIEKLPDKIVGRIDTKGSIYEVIIKFHRDGRAIIETFLLAHMISVTVSQTENSNVLLAYCRFQGNIKTLDDKLAALRQSAMVVLGDKEGTFLDFFVALSQLSQPLPHLLSSPRFSALPGFLKPAWIIQGLLVGLGLFAIWGVTTIIQGYHSPMTAASRMTNTPLIPSAAPTPTFSQWNPYVLPEYHQAWVDVKKKHNLSDETMIKLFRTIKQIDRYGPGHQLRDLTIFPNAIDRALSLIILNNVNGTETLRALLKTLEGYNWRGKMLPDNPEMPREKVQSLNIMFEDSLILNFYEQILQAPRLEFTGSLIQELRRSHLSG